MTASMRPMHLLSVDVEEHFQVSAFEGVVSRDDWSSIPSRVEANTERLLTLFDEAGVEATFFVLGWVGERYPALVRRIVECGHELACHGFSHRLVYTQTRETFAEETRRAKNGLEQIAGVEVDGYRAASFSIGTKNLWALDELAACGFRYDSSLFPVHHDRYGIPGAPRAGYRARTAAGSSLIEIPPSTIQLFGATLPFGGGGYFRLYPLALTGWMFRRLEKIEGRGGVIYLHPWEVDPDQPRIRAPAGSRFRHYVGLHRTAKKLRRLLSDFRCGSARQWLAETPDLPEVTL